MIHEYKLEGRDDLVSKRRGFRAMDAYVGMTTQELIDAAQQAQREGMTRVSLAVTGVRGQLLKICFDDGCTRDCPCQPDKAPPPV